MKCSPHCILKEFQGATLNAICPAKYIWKILPEEMRLFSSPTPHSLFPLLHLRLPSPPPLFFIFHIPIYFSNYLYLRFSCIWKNLSLSLESAFRSYKGRHKNTRQPARSRRLGVRHLRGRVKGEMEKGRQSKFPFPRITFPSFHIKISPEHFPQIRPSHLCLRVREESH